ncbi:MAG: TonB-dependent receptor [Acidobacteria bacterium]|nr:TonB-dependent receptor [Acidobacteriota bacterium]MBI3424212.1 TonB-dependent receptor [Acidobacteriota bacterium]
MRKTINFLLIGWVLGTFTLNPSLGIAANMVEAAPTLAFATGTVKDDVGKPLAGALVAVLEAQFRGKEIKSVKTDALGRFSAGIAPGAYRLRVTAEGFLPKLLPILLERPVNQNYNFELKRTDTLVQKRGDSDDYRWIGRSVPRHVLNFDEDVSADQPSNTSKVAVVSDSFTAPRPAMHGMVQMLAAGSSSRAGIPASSFFGTNFALSGTLGGNLEMAFIGQRGSGDLAPQRLAAYATMRPTANHQVTASIGYGQVMLSKRLGPDGEMQAATTLPLSVPRRASLGPMIKPPQALDQVSVSATDEWQVFQPLLVIYGFDYSRFVSSAAAQQDSVLPRIALQYTPTAQWRMSAAMTPRTSQNNSTESFSTENLNAPFETQTNEVAFAADPVLDRSRRFEMGVERIFENGAASLEASAFYDIVSGHGVGVLALPLEASPQTQAAIQQVAHQVAAMNGAARGARLMYARHFNEHVTAAVGYSYGYGARFSNHDLQTLTPGRLFNNGFFQVATAKLDLDFAQKTGTRVSTVVRLSPAAVVFAIDPFAGRMSVYDPNINIYVTQELPNFGLPLRWEALVDVRNLLNQSLGTDDGVAQIVAARAQRTVRGGLAFRW